MTWQPKQTVVVPIDFSESTPEALETAAQCAFGNENVHVLHVATGADFAPSFAALDADAVAARKQAAENRIQELVQENKLVGAHVAVLAGDPGQQIVEYAEQVGADLIVIPSHGYSGIQRLMLGSTTERVVRHASCPVYVLRRHDAK